jgi:uncharacterized protein with gpF-like domain
MTNARAIRWKTFDRKRWQFERIATARFRRALVATIRPALNAPSATEALSIADELPVSPLLDAYASTYGQVGSYFAVQTQGEIKTHGGVFETKQESATVFDRMMRDWIETTGAERVRMVHLTTIRRLKVAIQDGVNAGNGIEQIARDITRTGTGIADIKRARVIARTEIISASNLGSLKGAIETGIPLKKEWLATADSRTRDTHIEADGNAVLIEQNFIVGGDQLAFPGDWTNGASADQTINCRCTQIYKPL